MKDGTPAWSVVVVVFKGSGRVLGVSRDFNPRNPGFPGGDAEPSDEKPAHTARRELFEETGITAIELRCMEQWIGERGQPVFAFFCPRWKRGRLRTSNEGKPFWGSPDLFLVKTATYREQALRLLTRLGRVQPAA